MTKSSSIFIVAGALIIVGFALSIYGSQLIIENVSILEGTLDPTQTMDIQTTLEPEKNEGGRYVVQITDFTDEIVNIRVLDPNEVLIISKSVSQKSFEGEFEITSPGTYKLIIENPGDNDIRIVGAIGYMPNDIVLAVNTSSLIIIVVGLGGIMVGGVYLVRTRRKNRVS